MTWAAIGSAGIGLVGGMMGSNAQGAIENRKMGMEDDAIDYKKKQDKLRRQALQAQLDRAQNISAQGENQFQAETGAPLAELEAAKNAAIGGATEGQQLSNEATKVNLAQQGVRGGQAGSILARQAGQTGIGMQRDLSQMSLQEAERRRQMRAQYFGDKGSSGTKTALSTAVY